MHRVVVLNIDVVVSSCVAIHRLSLRRGVFISSIRISQFFPSCLLYSQHKLLMNKHAKGYRGRSKNCFRVAIRRVQKAWQYAYRDRKRKKRTHRQEWILQLNAACRQYQQLNGASPSQVLTYSRFIQMLRLGAPADDSNPQQPTILLNRKVLANLAVNEPFAFKSIVSVVQQYPREQLVPSYESTDVEQAA